MQAEGAFALDRGQVFGPCAGAGAGKIVKKAATKF
jgi:hypothetical protein